MHLRLKIFKLIYLQHISFYHRIFSFSKSIKASSLFTSQVIIPWEKYYGENPRNSAPNPHKKKNGGPYKSGSS